MISFDERSESYHANDAIGSGDIRNLLKSPMLFVDGRRGLCDRWTKALIFGVASHTRLLEPGAFATRVAVKPAGMSLATNAGKAWEARYAIDKEVITEAEAVHLDHMANRMPSEVRAIFDRCRKEVTVRTTMAALPEHEVQARPDLWDIDGGFFYDLKSIDSLTGGTRALSSIIFDRGYHIQLAWYQRVIEAETGTRPRCRLIFAEKTAPYRWRLVDLDIDYEDLGHEKVDEALAELSARLKSGCWEDRDGLEQLVSPPSWAVGEIKMNADGGINL